jgi:arginine decarboxylase
MLSEHPEIEAVYLTNPTYEGLCFDVSEMKTAVGPTRLFLIDEAHGAHFYFNSSCPTGALVGGADAAVTSIHKMLGSIYGTAIINVGKNSKLDAERVRMQHIMMAAGDGSCISPFLVMDVEACVKTFSENGEALVGNAIANSKKIKDTIRSLQNVHLAEWQEKYPFY